MITAKEIGSKRFEKSALGGYKADEVDRFLKDVAADVAQLQKEKDDADKKIDILADKVREYMRDEDVLKEALMGAQRQGHKIMEEAQLSAGRIQTEAKDKAEQIIAQTLRQLEAEKLALSNMQKEVAEFKARLLSLYKSHLDLITAMPDADVELPYVEKVREQPVEAEVPAEEAAKPQSPFPSVGAAGESHYTDLKFGRNGK